MSFKERLLEIPLTYRLWQAPFARPKLAPVLASNDLGRVHRVLDVGCGPGTNAALFQHAEYLGLDFNPAYIASARRRFKGRFVVADVTTYSAETEERFDFILVNSVLHHVGDADAALVLSSLERLLSPDGHVHVLDLVLPDHACLARTMARWDRGHHARSLERWTALFEAHFDLVRFQPYGITALGARLWNMVYFDGRARSGSPQAPASPAATATSTPR